MVQEKTRASFDFKWEHFPVTENENRPPNVTPEDRVTRYGWDVDEFENWISGKSVLDAGCGMGWWTDFLSELNKGGRVVGIDIAESAVAEGHELGHGELLVADIGSLPFMSETFEYISCEEVIHHTPDPESYLHSLTATLAPGGVLTLYIYKKKPFLREMADTAIRERTTGMNIEECLEFSEQLTELGKQLYEVDEEITVPEMPLLDIEEGTYIVHEFVYRHFLKCFFDWHGESWEASVACNFDWYHPEYAFRYTEAEVKNLIDGIGLSTEYFDEMMSAYCLRARKPE